MGKNKILALLTISFVLTSAYLSVYYLLDKDYHQPFPFFHINNEDGGIKWDGYADYLFWRIIVLILIGIITIQTPKYREYLFTFWCLWIGYLIDYLLVFNQPFGWWHFIPLSYSLFAGISMIALTFFQWKRKL